jgi:hypothetical protein
MKRLEEIDEDEQEENKNEDEEEDELDITCNSSCKFHYHLKKKFHELKNGFLTLLSKLKTLLFLI